MKTVKKLCSFFIAVLTLVSAVSVSCTTEAATPSLKASSALTISAEDGYLHGIWGTVTAEKLAAEFEDTVQISSNGKAISGSTAVSSDDTVSAGGTSISVLIYGDSDRNGRINLSDVSMMLKHIAKWEVTPCSAASDTDMNDKVTLADVSSLLRWIAGWDITLGDSVFPKTELKLNGNFSIVIPKIYDPFEMEAAKLLSAALDKIYGENKGNGRIITDDMSAVCEILVGNTARSRSADARKKLGEFEWSYDIPTNRSVVITGSDPIGTYEAVSAFVWDLFGYVDRNNVISSYNKWNGSEYVTVNTSSTLTTGTKYIYDHGPSERSLTLGGRDISEYVIVDKSGHSDSAELLRRAIERETGHSLSVVSKKEAVSAPTIRLGIGKEESGEFLIGLSTNVFAIGLSGDDILIDVLDYSKLLHAVRAFDEWYIRGGLDLTEGEIKYGGIGSNLLRETSRTDTDISDGVTYSEIRYTDKNGLPVIAYVVKADRGAERVMMGMMDNGTAVTNSKATVLDAINAAEADGIDIAAGVNADFFHIESDYSPVGLCVKDGVILKQNTETKPWIAVMKDGTFDCGIAGEARSKITSMDQGFGASHVLLKYGIVYQDGVGDSFGEIRHPRTAMGYDGEGNVYLIVVDGRRPKLSNGASLLDLTIIFRDLGVTSGVNLDGGGSSTMIVDEDGFVTKNSPSDGALRKVFNSVLIKK